MYLTWFDSNGWLIELGGKRILLDPWLVGSLSFGGAEWFFKATHATPPAIPEAIDAILLSQGLPDHAHPPTLAALDRQIPVIGSPGAAAVARGLGFSQVVALEHGQTHRLGDSPSLDILATVGSPTGPGKSENGYILRTSAALAGSAASLYYEPHGFYPSDLATLGPVDVALTPLISLAIALPLGLQIPIIQGDRAAVSLAERLRPQVLVPTSGAGSAVYEGLLVKALRAIGSLEGLRASLAAAGLANIQVMEPIVGQRFAVSLAASPVGVV